MKENIKSRLTIILVSVATLCLAGIAVFTATKIFQSKNKSVTPTTPEVEPLAQIPTSSPTPFPTVSPTAFLLSPTPTTGLLAQAGSPTPTTRITLTPSPTPTASISATLTPTKKLTVSPTTAPVALPDSGFSIPTIIGLSVGLVLLFAGLLLAL